jgi:hypothetical protein
MSGQRQDTRFRGSNRAIWDKINYVRSERAGHRIMAIGANLTFSALRRGANLRKLLGHGGIICVILFTLMSAFTSSRRVNSWLSFKHLLQALPGKAGGTTVMTTVDHTLMRGLEPHDR